MMTVQEGKCSLIFRFQMETMMLSGRKLLDLQPQSSQKSCFWIPVIYVERWSIAQTFPKSFLLLFKAQMNF